MNRTETAQRVAERTGLSASATASTLDAMCDTITEALGAGEEVRLTGFGTFAAKQRPAREGRNPGTGEKVAIAASTVATFKPGKTLKNALNGA